MKSTRLSVRTAAPLALGWSRGPSVGRRVRGMLVSITMTPTPSPPVDDTAQMIEAFKALGNPVRLKILQWLRDPERHFPVQDGIADSHDVGVCVSHIQMKTGLAQSTVSAYMAALERAGLVTSTRVGKWTHYQRNETNIARLMEALDRSL